MRRTIRFPLRPTAEQECVLLATMQQYTASFNTVAAYGWERCGKNGVELHRATYYPLRADHPQLPAQLVISARTKATEAVKFALTWKVKREREYPKRVAKALARRTAVFQDLLDQIHTNKIEGTQSISQYLEKLSLIDSP